jgi:hypothetical protein
VCRLAGALDVGDTLLVALRVTGEVGPRAAILLTGWLLAAGWCRFLGTSTLVVAAGLVLQTILAVFLIFRWKAGSVQG